MIWHCFEHNSFHDNHNLRCNILCYWTVMQERGGMRTTRIIACPKRKKMLYERQCKCVVLVLSEKLTHQQLTTVTRHHDGLNWGLQKKLQCLHYRAVPCKTRTTRYIQGTVIVWLRLQRYTCELTKKNRACLGYWSLNLDKDGHVNGQFNKKKKIQVTTVKDKLLQKQGKT